MMITDEDQIASALFNALNNILPIARSALEPDELISGLTTCDSLRSVILITEGAASVLLGHASEWRKVLGADGSSGACLMTSPGQAASND